MLERLKREWRILQRGKPGSRFQQVYAARDTSSRLRWVWMVVGCVIVVVGIVALPAPGPGFLVIGVGVALLSREFAIVARLADWIEVRARRVARWAERFWRRASLPARAAIVVLGLTLAGTAAFVTYRFFF